MYSMCIYIYINKQYTYMFKYTHIGMNRFQDFIGMFHTPSSIGLNVAELCYMSLETLDGPLKWPVPIHNGYSLMDTA